MVNTLVREKVSILFTIGGDGTLRGAHALAEEVQRRALSIAIVGIPKVFMCVCGSVWVFSPVSRQSTTTSHSWTRRLALLRPCLWPSR